jgi:Tfp pilus assembly PilM family ATPase
VARDGVITCLSGAHALHRTLTMPQIRREDLGSAVIYQAKRELPVPTEELYTAWQVVGSDEQHLQVFLVGVPKDVVDAYMTTINLAHIKLRSLDVKPLALARVSEHPTALICNLEPDSVDIVYVSEFAPALVRTVYFQDPATSPPELAERLSSELYRSVRFYNDTNRMTAVSPATPLILAGSALDYYALADALYGSVEYGIERLQPPFEYPEDFPLEEYAANLGLALKR